MAGLELICGPMFSGKSGLLVARLADASAAGLRVLAVKPEIAVEPGWIASRAGPRWPAVSLAAASELADVVAGHDLVGIDEAHFFDDDLVEAVGHGATRFVVAGLDLDFRGEPFAPIARLVPRADRVTRLTATCARCGAEATRSQRLVAGRPADADSPQIVVARHLYEPRCTSCFEAAPSGAVRRVATRGGRRASRV